MYIGQSDVGRRLARVWDAAADLGQHRQVDLCLLALSGSAVWTAPRDEVDVLS